MPRMARERSVSGIYHAMVRGINGETVFRDDDDRLNFLFVLYKVKQQGDFSLLGYCLMDNHVHLLLREGAVEGIGQTMQRIGTSFAHRYNTKYLRYGHLFQDRFRSVPIEQPGSVLAALRYVHQNPVKARLCQTCGDYRWSSQAAYEGREPPPAVTDTDLAVDIAGGKGRLLAFLSEAVQTEEIDSRFSLESPVSELEVSQAWLALLRDLGAANWVDLPRERRAHCLQQLRQRTGASVTQIARVTGMPKSTVSRLLQR